MNDPGHPFRKRLNVFDMFSGGQDELRAILQEVTGMLRVPELFGPFYTITHELTVNALKAVYKKIFFEKFIMEIGLEDIDYQKWLVLFKSEIETHNAENFSRMIRETDQAVGIAVRLTPGHLRILVTNPGAPSRIEMQRIQNSLKMAREMEHLSPILDQAAGDHHQEGASLGLPLVIMSLRKMGADEDGLRIVARGDRTFAEVAVRREVLEKYTPAPDVDLT